MIIFEKEYFSLKKICDSGQVLLGWEEREDGSYYVTSLDKTAHCFETEDGVVIDCPASEDSFWANYFDLSTDYAEIEKQAVGDEYLKEALAYGRGIRILRQNIWEALFSFIISQNNNIPRITGSIRRIKDGSRVLPGPEEMYPVRERLRDCGLGYRDEYLIRLLEELHEGSRTLVFSEDTEKASAELKSIHGVGPKVADCVLLFGLHRMERCPVDTWMKKIFAAHYGGKKPGWTESPWAGYYQQVTFFYERTGGRNG